MKLEGFKCLNFSGRFYFRNRPLFTNPKVLNGSWPYVEGVAVFDKGDLDSWVNVPTAEVFRLMVKVQKDEIPPLWLSPPEIAGRSLRNGLMVLTSGYRLYHIPDYKELYRVMLLRGDLYLVQESGVEQLVMETYVKENGPAKPFLVPNAGGSVIAFRKPLLKV